MLQVFIGVSCEASTILATEVFRDSATVSSPTLPAEDSENAPSYSSKMLHEKLSQCIMYSIVRHTPCPATEVLSLMPLTVLDEML